jgi:hypothetical protein
MMIALLLLVGLIGMWIIRRRARASELAGRNVERPTYSVEPPARRVGRRKYELL